MTPNGPPRSRRPTAGLNVLQIINEPTAAALAYGLDKLDQDQTVFVFDLGGGTFDVTIMRIENHHIRMLASNGDHRLGGKDWDDVIVNWVAEEFDERTAKIRCSTCRATKTCKTARSPPRSSSRAARARRSSTATTARA